MSILLLYYPVFSAGVMYTFVVSGCIPKDCFPNPSILCSSVAANMRVNIETIRAVLGLPVPFDDSHVLLAICSHSASTTIVSHATLHTTSLSIPLNLPKLQYLQSVGRSYLAKFHSNKMKHAD